MSSGTVAISDIVVPNLFSPYVQVLTEEKSRLIQSGALGRSAALDAFLAGPGLTMSAPRWKDLDNDADSVARHKLPGFWLFISSCGWRW